VTASAILAALSQFLCEPREDMDRPAPCVCGVVPGTLVIPDMFEDCGGGRNGVAWVRIAATYPSQTVGVAYQNVGNCSSGIGYDIEVGVVREHSDYYEADTIDADDSAAIVQWQVDDMEAVRRAIVCCDSLDEKDFILGMYQPIGPQGGLVGGAWMVHVSVV